MGLDIYFNSKCEQIARGYDALEWLEDNGGELDSISVVRVPVKTIREYIENERELAAKLVKDGVSDYDAIGYDTTGLDALEKYIADLHLDDEDDIRLELNY